MARNRRLPILWIETWVFFILFLLTLIPAIDDCLFYGLKLALIGLGIFTISTRNRRLPILWIETA